MKTYPLLRLKQEDKGWGGDTPEILAKGSYMIEENIYSEFFSICALIKHYKSL